MKKVLLVDDERIFHFLSTKIFEVSGADCEVHSAYDGNEAMQQLSDGLSPHFIFVDLDMPNMNGFQFIEAYKQKYAAPHSTLVVLSSSVTEEERKRVLALGADVYLSKPLSENEVRTLLML
ncbi:MAG TPA: response regulator [Chryseosolibacter sp.]